MGPWSFRLAALLWAVPSLIAIRSLPLLASVPIAFFTAAVGRVIAFHDPLTAMLAAAVLVPVLLVDRWATTWLPRAGALAFPAALVVLACAVDASSAGPALAAQLLPLPPLSALSFVASDAGTSAAVFVAAGFASAFATLGAILNRHIKDPYSAQQRDMGARVAGVVALVVGIALLIAGAIRLELSGPPSAVCDPGNGAAAASALLLVVLVAAALSSWRGWRSAQRGRALAPTR